MKTSVSMLVNVIATRMAMRPDISSVTVSNRLSESRAGCPRMRTSAMMPPSLMACIATSIRSTVPNERRCRCASGTGPSRATYSRPAASTISVIRPAFVSAALMTERSGTPLRSRCQG